MRFLVNEIPIEYTAVGDRDWGKSECLLDGAIDLTGKTNWAETGFTIDKLFDDNLYQIFLNQTTRLLVSLWRKAGLQIPDSFQLDQYHTVASSKEAHLTAVEFTKLISVSEFPVPIKILEDRISEICKGNLIVKNPFDGQSVFHFRIIRPNQPDNNPLHRDVWLEDYDDCINLYIPITGSNERSSLILAPGSHRWPESFIEKTVNGAEINGVKFNVPAVTNIRQPVEFERPNPKDNEVLIFSPYLIHGGSGNLNDNATRISIEVRLWKNNVA